MDRLVWDTLCVLVGDVRNTCYDPGLKNELFRCASGTMPDRETILKNVQRVRGVVERRVEII